MVGIDVSKATLAVCLLLDAGQGELQQEFCNVPSGHRRLHRWIRQHGATVEQICMESTGSYHLALAAFLHEQQNVVSIVNPRRIHAYAKSRLSRAKTDGVDARLIAQFGLREPLPIWSPPTAAQTKVRDLQSRIDEIGRTLTRHRQRREHCQDPAVLASLEREEHFWKQELGDLEQQVNAVLRADSTLGEVVDRLVSIPGVGRLTAIRFVAQVDISRFERASSFAAYLGVTPSEHSSGTSVHQRPRMSKMGAKNLRRALYFPAVQATKYNPQIKALYERLIAKGHAKKSALGAAMRKLAHQIYGVWTSGLPYHPTKGLPA
jgi:transposase